jgi:type II secretory pathway pseudopilin PulG
MKRARKDSGFALLLVLLMAALIAISLYMELPRVAVESQRQKEQLLILRGEEYKRAILVFYKTNSRWPTKIEDLESFNNRRFLRRRFKDPMTGTDEWKLIHINNGVFTDSVTNQPKTGTGAQAADAAPTNQYVGNGGGMFNGSAGTAPAGPDLGRRRLSDGGMGGGTVVPMDPSATSTANSGTSAPQDPNAPTAPGSNPGDPNAPNAGNPAPTVPPVPGANPPDGSQPGAPGQPVMPPGMPGAPPGMPGMPPGFPGVPGAPVNSQTGGVSATPYPTMPGANGSAPPFPQPGATNQGANAAQNMISQILSSPRPGGAPVGTTATSGGGLVIGGGIAGVASKADAVGIMVYNDRTNYKEWEFIFDPTKWRAPANPLAGAGTNGTPASQMGNLQQTQIGTSVSDIVAQQNGTATSTSGSATGATGATGSTVGSSPVIKQ